MLREGGGWMREHGFLATSWLRIHSALRFAKGTAASELFYSLQARAAYVCRRGNTMAGFDTRDTSKAVTGWMPRGCIASGPGSVNQTEAGLPLYYVLWLHAMTMIKCDYKIITHNRSHFDSTVVGCRGNGRQCRNPVALPIGLSQV